MAFVHCPNGHIYDNIKYKECPFCLSSDNAEISANSSTELADDANNNRTEAAPNTFSQKTLLDEEAVESSASGKTQGEANLDGHTVVMEYEQEQTASPEKTGQKKPPRRIEGFLVTYDFDKYGNFYPLYLGKNFIGRNTNNDIVLNDPSVSNEHALILFRGNQILLEDKLSVNGTFLNDSGQSIDRCTLKDNDFIRFGKMTFKIKIIGEMNVN